MKIAFVVRHPTQFEVPFYKFIRETDPDNQFHVYYLTAPEAPRTDTETGVTVDWQMDLTSAYTFYVLTASPEADLNRFMRRGYDLVIFNGYKGRFGELAGRLRKKNVRIALRLDTVAFNLSRLEIWLRQVLLISVYARFNRYFVTGTASKHYLAQIGIPENRIQIFSYCIDELYFKRSPHRRTAGARRNILVVSKFIHREYPGEVIDAFGALNDPELTLIVVGDGKLKVDLELRARKYPALHIRFTGYVAYHRLAAFYYSSALFIHPARHEPWGVSVQEAMSCGCRVVCSDKVGSARDLIVEGRNGFIYRSGRVDELADCMVKSLRIPTAAVEQANSEVLRRWNYHYMWQEILHSAGDV